MNLLKLTKSAAVLLALTLIADCSSPNPAAPPAPPAELPSALQIPSSVTINVDEIRPSSPPALMAALVAPNGPFSDDISFGSSQVIGENSFVDGILGPLSTFSIPVTSVTNHFEGDTTINGSTSHVKIDFSDFDFDNDGKAEGCPGNTASLPICTRIWADGTPVMAAVFTAFPTADSPGAGRLRGFNVDAHSGVEVGTQVIYDHTDPTNLSTEISYGLGSFGSDPATPPTFFIAAHSLITQKGTPGIATKTLFFSGSFDEGSSDASTGQYIGRFRETKDFWSGTVDLENPAKPAKFSDQCAQISTGTGVLQSDCLNLGLDVSGLSFISFLDPAEIIFPSDFPSTPTF